MPFDGVSSKMSNRISLINTLRYDPQVRKRWDFRYCNTCALQVAKEMGLSVYRDLGLRNFSAAMIFGHIPSTLVRYGVSMKNVTPDMVADALECVTLVE